MVPAPEAGMSGSNSDDLDPAWLADVMRAQVRDAILPRLDSCVADIVLFGLSLIGPL